MQIRRFNNMELKVTANILFIAITCQLATVIAQSCDLAVNETLCPSRSNYALLSANQTTDNYIYLSGIFGVHAAAADTWGCGAVLPRRVQQVEAFLWAVETFQNRYSDGNKVQGRR